MTLTPNDVRILLIDDTVELWYARGLEDYYPTKLCVEIALRARYPDEDEDTRYARIYFHTFYYYE